MPQCASTRYLRFLKVELDVLTGAHTIIRADLVQDVGKSLNPAIDIGQCEGAFMQGVGWLTIEDLLWDKNGRMDINYDIPMVGLQDDRCNSLVS